MEPTIAQIEEQIEQLQKLVHLRDLVLKLENNRDYKKLILEHFCQKECARYAQVSGDPEQSDTARADSLGKAQAAGHLLRFLTTTVQIGNQAANMIAHGQEALEEMRGEEA